MRRVSSAFRIVVVAFVLAAVVSTDTAVAQPAEGLVGTNIRHFLQVGTATGGATPVSGLGLLGLSSVSGLAFDPNTNTLYGVDAWVSANTGQLIRIDTNTGIGTAIGALGFESVFDLAFDPSTNTLYGLSEGNELITINTANGRGTVVGALGFTNVTSLAFAPNTHTLYGVDNNTHELLTIDTGTGAGTAVGNLGFAGASGLAFDSNTNTLYGSELQTGLLLTIDTTTGVATAVGGGLGSSGLAFDPNGNTLYGVNGQTDELMTIDTNTGEATPAGNLGFREVQAVAFDPNTNTMYGIDIPYGGSSKLITIDTTTGEATLVGYVGFGAIYAIAFDRNTNTLYGVDWQGLTASRLITIDTSTGAGTVVGSVGSSQIYALAFDPNTNTLYGWSQDHLITINTSTGAGTPVGGPLESGLIVGLAFDANSNTLYGSIPGGSAGSGLVTINTSTGAVTTIVSWDVSFVGYSLTFDPNSSTLFGTNSSWPLMKINTTTGAFTTVGAAFVNLHGLAYDPDTETLYGSATDGYTLVTVDGATGEATTVGQMDLSIYDLAFDRNTHTLYGVSLESDELITIDTATGAGTPVGPLGFDIQGPFEVWGLAFDASTNTLYGSDLRFGRLITIDTSTGQGTAIGAVASLGFIEGLAFDPITHTLYGVDTHTEELYVIDTATGTPTLVGPTWYVNIKGLAFVTSYSACDEFTCPCPGPPQIGSGSFLANQDDCLESSDGGIRLCLDAGDLAQDEVLSVVQTAVNQHDEDLTVSASPGLGVAVALYDLGPDGLMFANPVRVTTVHDVSNYNENQRSRLDLFARDGQGQNLEPLQALCCIDENPPGTFTARCTYQLTHFSEYGPVLPEDTDNDGVFDLYDGIADNCLLVANADQADSDGNGVGDCCDSAWSGFIDNDGDGIYDLCCTSPVAPMAEAAPLPKGRYLAFAPSNFALQTAIRVVPRVLPGFESSEGTPLWVGRPKAFPEENSAQPGLTFLASALSCEPHYQDWSTIDLLYVFGGEVIPGATYDVQAICAGAASLADEANYSSPLVVTTGVAGDIMPLFDGNDSGVPQPDFNDIASVVQKFIADPDAPIKARAQLQPNTALPSRPIDFKDIAEGVSAFVGEPYAYSGPCSCPSSVTCRSVTCLSDSNCSTGYCVDIGSAPRGRGYCIDACGRCSP